MKELAPELDLRQELAVRAGLGPHAGPEMFEDFLAWAEEEPWLLKRRVLIWLTRLLPLLPLTLIALWIGGLAGMVPSALFLSLVLNFLVRRRLRAELEGTLHRAFGQERTFSGYHELFELIAGSEFRAPALRRIKDDLCASGAAAHQEMERLARIKHRIDARESMWGGVLQLVTLWDFHAVFWLERWKQAVGSNVRSWFSQLGEFEALASLSGLAHDHPTWVFPELIEDGPPMFEAEDLGHPLIAADVRVCNDVKLGPPGTFILITGSNMSGKSTLLRAVGTNVALGLAGGPVCAAAMRLPSLALQTTMRVSDSLEAGLSHFMAELQRLKRVVQAAEAARDSRAVLYLLDDILQGTNTAERQIAARKIIAHLLAENAIGAVASHDLNLADTEELSAACSPVHFSDTIESTPEGPRITFDYKLRPGVATSRNALRLLELVGLDFDVTNH